MKKRILIGMIVIILMTSGIFDQSTIYASEEYTEIYSQDEEYIENALNERKNNDEKMYQEISEDAEFKTGEVIVTIKCEYSEEGKTFDYSDFPEVDIKGIEYLTELPQNTNDESVYHKQYYQILLLYLQENNRQAVLDAVNVLNENPIVKTAEPNYIVHMIEPEENIIDSNSLNDSVFHEDSINAISSITPNDSLYNDQWGLKMINMPQAWELTTGSKDVKIGVVDTGIGECPDLKTNVNVGKNFENNKIEQFGDTDGHGTHVAGIIGAKGNNNQGITGIVWNTSLIPLRVSYTGTSMGIDKIIQAIQYAEENQIPILNMSCSGDGFSRSFYDAINMYSGLVVASAGNDGKITDNNLFFPGGFDCDNIICVANLDQNGKLHSSSNYGNITTDLAAPGTNIVSTYPVSGNVQELYVRLTGTSMAAPHVAGVAALLLSYNSNLSPYQIKRAIMDSVTKSSDMAGKTVSGGYLNAYNALNQVLKNKVLNYKVVLKYKNLKNDTLVSYDAEVEYDKELASFYNCTFENSVFKEVKMDVTDAKNKIQIDAPQVFVNDSEGILAELRFNCPMSGKNKNCLDGFGKGQELVHLFGNSSITTSMTKVLMGDVNLDNEVNSIDVNLISRYVVKATTFSETQLLAADVNEDGVVNSDDTLKVQRYIVKQINTFWK